jgi:hypothetical protein
MELRRNFWLARRIPRFVVSAGCTMLWNHWLLSVINPKVTFSAKWNLHQHDFLMYQTMISLPNNLGFYLFKNSNLLCVGDSFLKVYTKVLSARVNLPDDCKIMQFEGSTWPLTLGPRFNNQFLSKLQKFKSLRMQLYAMQCFHRWLISFLFGVLVFKSIIHTL